MATSEIWSHTKWGETLTCQRVIIRAKSDFDCGSQMKSDLKRCTAPSTHPETGKHKSRKSEAQSPDNSRCRETSRSRCLVPLQCSSKCILWFRAAIVGTLERIACTFQLYHYVLLYDTHTISLGGLVCNAEKQPIACKQRSHVTCMSLALLHSSRHTPTSISASLPQINHNQNARFAFPFSCSCVGPKYRTNTRRRRWPEEKPGGGRAALTWKTLSPLQDRSLVWKPDSSGLDVSTGSRRNAKLLHRQPVEADIWRTLGALQLAVFLSLSLFLCISLLSNDAQRRGHATFNVRERAPSHEQSHVKNQLEPYSCFCGAQCAAVRVCDGLLLRFSSGSAAPNVTSEKLHYIYPGTALHRSCFLCDSTDFCPICAG